MSLCFKSGNFVFGLQQEILQALDIAASIWPVDLWVTSTRWNDKHKWSSLHYSGHAVDLRTRNLTEKQINDVTAELRLKLGKDYDVVIEGNHIHMEYDPKEPATHKV